MSPPDDDEPPKKKYPRASWEPPDPDEPAPPKQSSDKSGATRSGAVSSETASTASGSTKTEPTASKRIDTQPSVVVSGASVSGAGSSGSSGPSSRVDPMASGSASGGWSISQSGRASTSSGSSGTASGSSGSSSSGSSDVVRDTAPGGYKPPSDESSPEAVPTAVATAPVSTSAIVGSTNAEPSSKVSSLKASSREDDVLLPLPSSLSDADDDDDLRLAVGAKPKKVRTPPPPPDDGDDDELDDDGEPKKRSKLMLVVVSTVTLGAAIGAFVLFGHINKQRYVIACEPQQVIAKQGRGFPPWGERAIDDDGMWKPIKIPPEAECRERETEDIDELSRWYLDILMDRASTMLTAREVTKIDEAAGMLDQALLHARAPDRRSDRRDIERLLGDVGYWRASAKLKDAASALGDAAKQFDAAAAQRPRHVSDASAWATYVRKIAEELKAGPNGTPSTVFPPTPPTTDRPPAPPGVALPVEPPSAGSGSAEPPPPPIDAGLPTGGVLL